MGYTFAAALLKKNCTASSTRKAFREALENLGYRKAASAEDAALSLRMYHDKKSAWLSLAMEIPESLDAELSFLRKVSAEMHMPILYFLNLDSDFLYVAATDGAGVQHVHVGWIDEENAEAMRDSDDLSIFDALLPDAAARAEFCRILAVDEKERVFSEEAAQEMAVLFGYTPEVLFVDEDAPPFAELNYVLGGGGIAGSKEAVPFLMPEDAPPALRVGSMGLCNPSDITIFSNGGVGKGIRVVLWADGYDARDWELPVLWLSNEYIVRLTGRPADIPFDDKVVPRRCKFQDGKEGWIAEFPDAPICRGVNPESQMEYTKKGYDYHYAHSLNLSIAFRGGSFSEYTLQQLDLEKNPDPVKRLEWLRAERERGQQPSEGETNILIAPVENPGQGICQTIPRLPFRKELPNNWLRGYWPEDELK